MLDVVLLKLFDLFRQVDLGGQSQEILEDQLGRLGR